MVKRVNFKLYNRKTHKIIKTSKEMEIIMLDPEKENAQINLVHTQGT